MRHADLQCRRSLRLRDLRRNTGVAHPAPGGCTCHRLRRRKSCHRHRCDAFRSPRLLQQFHAARSCAASLSFVLHGGTYFPPTAIMASHASARCPIECRQHDLSQEHPLPDAEQQLRRRPSGRTTAFTNSKPPLFSTARRQPPARPWIQRRSACSRIYRAAVRRSHLSLPGRPQQGDRPQARNDGNDRESPRPGDHAQARRMQPDAGRHRRGARLRRRRRRTGSRGFTHGDQTVDISLAMIFRHGVPNHCAIRAEMNQHPTGSSISALE